MGLVYADIELIRSDDLALQRAGYLQDRQVRRMRVKALVDSGTCMLAINENFRVQLNLAKLDEQLAELADGSKQLLDIVGPVELHFENRRTTVDAMVLPDDAEVLLGSIPMEDMDVLIDPKRQTLIVNPASPYIARKSLK
jgi:clan AA aspartic protease